MQKVIGLVGMEKGQHGVVHSIHGGGGLARRLKSLGLRPGSQVTKVSNLFNCGPIVLKVSGTEVALGFGIAKRIDIEINTGERS